MRSLNIKYNNGRILRLMLAVLAVAFSFSLSGCGEDDNGDVAELTGVDLVSRGWDRFESGDYSSALNDFNSAYNNDNSLSDALNGSGWSAGRLTDKLDEADDYFKACLDMDANRYDALGGWMFITYQLGEWQSALDKADVLLHDKPGWIFLHETTIDFRDVRLMTAAAHYNLGQYTEALDIIVSYLNQEFETDVSTRAGQQELLEEIERLRQIYG